MADTTIAANLRANLATVRRFHRQPRQSHEEDKQEEAFLLPFPVCRRPRSRRVNTTPLSGGAAPRRGCGPLGHAAPARLDARLQPRVPRSPAPLARRPPVLTRHEGRRARCSPAIGWSAEEHRSMMIIRTIADLTRHDVRRIQRARYEILAIETRYLGQDETTEILWSRQDPPNAIREEELPF
jgi:hypothetical protein